MSLFGKYYFARRHAALFDADEAANLLEPAEVGDVWQPPTDVVEFSAKWVVRMELGGVALADVQVRVSRRRLTVNGVRRPWCPHESADNPARRPWSPPQRTRPVYRQMEMRHGLFSRTVVFPADVNAKAVAAGLSDGVLEIELPRAEEAESPAADWLVVALARGES